MIYGLLRTLAGLALHWYYQRIDVEGLERVPRQGPLLLVVNHPNALVDAMVIAWSTPRRIVLTAKATLFRNAVLAWLFHHMGVVPLIRASDLPAVAAGAATQPSRNAAAFRALHAVLRRGGTILIFPEGKSHDEPALAPLRTGAARIALDARDTAGVQRLHIVPVGLTFEHKDAPRSRVLVQVAEPIAMDDWMAPDEDVAAHALTGEIDARLRAVTLNYATSEDAELAAARAALLAALFTAPTPLDPPGASLHDQVSMARRFEEARPWLAVSMPPVQERADRLLQQLDALQRELDALGIAAGDLEISTSWRQGTVFLLREGGILATAGPVALWGEINHWLPFRAARAIALRSVESASDPAMRTILAGVGLVLGCYAVQGALVAGTLGGVAALLYIASLPLAAQVTLLWRDHASRVRRRAHTFLLMRRQPGTGERLREEASRLRVEALAVVAALRELSAPGVAGTGRPDPSARQGAARRYEDPSAA